MVFKPIYVCIPISNLFIITVNTPTNLRVASPRYVGDDFLASLLRFVGIVVNVSHCSPLGGVVGVTWGSRVVSAPR